MTESFMDKMRVVTNYDQSEFWIQTYTETWWSRLMRLFYSQRTPTYYWAMDSITYFSAERALEAIARRRNRKEFLEKHGSEYREL